MKNIVLIGMMGCGKSTCAALLARRLGMEVADTDAIITQREGRAIPDLFTQEGEDYFRDRELGLSTELGPRKNLIISCGGGLPLQPECMTALGQNGVVVFLCRDPADTFDTVPMEGRPLAQAGREAFIQRFQAREPIYRACADLIIDDFSSPEATVNAILEGLQ